MKSILNYHSKILNKNSWKEFEAYFEFGGKCSGCWCMNHRLPIGLDFKGEAAKLAMKQLVLSNRVFGILAFVENDRVPVGFCALDRKNTLPGHDCIANKITSPNSTWSIHCTTSRQDYKSKGVESYLLDEVTKLCKSMSGSNLEVYPEPKSIEGEEFKTWNTFNGYESYFLQNNFKKPQETPPELSNFFSILNKKL
ncbi:MAG: hypothetical protein COB02_00040 [Candidatus Cloacimonadota bacterium]|nr:MAG: hypothetical protein COB02_04175 [Candidatus Cloacimonadota bacterium]PCJ21012.1 MAG: hypothetical protein COB02_00040 [Candidatus Cloacimonadota bacterium]